MNIKRSILLDTSLLGTTVGLKKTVQVILFGCGWQLDLIIAVVEYLTSSSVFLHVVHLVFESKAKTSHKPYPEF